MTIEINRKNSKYIYRISPYNNLEIDRRVNRHGARWMWYARRENAADARAYLLELEKEAKEQAK